MNKSITTEKSRVIVHVDMDAFFAAVEQRDNPGLRGKPVVVGADPQGGKGRGVVSTCSYEARKFGVHSAQPISEAYRRCPQAVFLPPDFKKYSQVSAQIHKIFYDFTPDVEPISIDEAFLDITGSFHFYKTPLETCRQLKKRIKEEVRLTASVGIAPVKFVAKIASDFSKPDGLLEITAEKLLNFLHPLPIEKLWGVGPKTKEALNRFGIKTVGDLARYPAESLIENFGEHGRHLLALAHGIDNREVVDSDEIKSVSHEHTFDKDTNNKEEISRVLLELTEKVSRRLRKDDLKGKTVTLKVRLKGFKTYTRAVTLKQRTNLVDDIYKEVKALLDGFFKPGHFIRLVGVRVSHFEDAYVQDSLFEDSQTQKKEKVHQAIDSIKNKFGEEAIHRGV